MKILLLFVVLLSHSAYAQNCLDKRKRNIPVQNEQVLEWKKNSRNQTKYRTHVLGSLNRVYPDRNTHNHFAIQIGPNRSDTLEVVYNNEFGKLPKLKMGDEVEACGDYITSKKASRYPASPDGAIIHWVHVANRSDHLDGFLMINDVVYGNKP
ncbi:MAG: DUF3465 domain-containing protein [Xanthomonadaceae bacterium]|nr:DUF3465 domain-containing protein [Xanthomonadaceae bacterium]